jgi:hypothetical protein
VGKVIIPWNLVLPAAPSFFPGCGHRGIDPARLAASPGAVAGGGHDQLHLHKKDFGAIQRPRERVLSVLIGGGSDFTKACSDPAPEVF